MRRNHRRRRAREPQPLGPRLGRRVHPRQDGALPGHCSARRRRPLRQRGEPRRLRRRQILRRAAEIAPAGPDDSRRLLAVRREIDVEDEDLALRIAVLEPQRDDRLAQLPGERARPAGQHHLRHLLRDGRPSFDQAQMPQVVQRGAGHGDRIDAEVPLEPAVLRGDRRPGHVVRHLGQPFRARPVRRQRLVQHDAVAIGDQRRRIARDGREGAQAEPQHQEPVAVQVVLGPAVDCGDQIIEHAVGHLLGHVSVSSPLGRPLDAERLQVPLPVRPVTTVRVPHGRHMSTATIPCPDWAWR